jgi:hypothetical protein
MKQPRYTLRTVTKTVITALPYPQVQRYLIALMMGSILVCNIEQSIAVNAVGAGEETWTYGQILAIALAIVPVMQVLQLLGYFKSNGDGAKLNRRKRD